MIKHTCKTKYNVKNRIIINFVLLLISLSINIYNPSNSIFSPTLAITLVYWMYFFNLSLYSVKLSDKELIVKRGFIKRSFETEDIKAISYYNNASRRNMLAIITSKHSPYYVPVKAVDHIQISRILNSLQTDYKHIEFNFNLYDFMVKKKEVFSPFKHSRGDKEIPHK